MPDISMCSNDECPARMQCYRFTATPSQRQAYAGFRTPRHLEHCKYFISNKKPARKTETYEVK